MIRVMVVDDSPLVRKVASDILASDPEIAVVATAAQAEFALLKLERERPDVVTLDLEMPGIGGLEAIRRIMSTRPTPIVVLSAHAKAGAERTIQALELGAVDFVPKPSFSLSGGVASVAAELIEKVKGAARIDNLAGAKSGPDPRPTLPLLPAGGDERGDERHDGSVGRNGGSDFAVVAIGASTGGPVALKTILSMLPGDLPAGIVVVQHMPPGFTRAFADRLNQCSALSVKEAEEGDAILPGRVLIAPGNWHMTVARPGGEARITLGQSASVNGHRPSVDLLMRSVAAGWSGRTVGVIMTGMGRDGAAGIAELRQAGGWIIAQDRESSAIYGMNREVIESGNADEIAPVDAIARRIARAVAQSQETG